MNKVMKLGAAIEKFVNEGDHIAFGGFTTQRKPFAAVHEILRQGQGDLILEGGPAGGEADLLIGAGRVKAYINAYTANSGFSNVSRRFREAIEQGTIFYEDYSLDTQPMMFHAAALGLPYIAIRHMLGSDLAVEWGISEKVRKGIDKLPDQKLIIQENPFVPGEKLVLLPTPKLDVAIIHVQKASEDGTVRIEGAPLHDVDIAMAAKYCIVTCEELVTKEYLQRDSGCNSLPCFVPNAIVHVPYGAHPSQLYNYYDYDSEYYSDYDKAGKTQEAFDTFLQEWVYSTASHEGYIRKLGANRLANLKVAPGWGFVPNTM